MMIMIFDGGRFERLLDIHNEAWAQEADKLVAMFIESLSRGVALSGEDRADPQSVEL